MSVSSDIKILLFDLGGVVIEIDFDRVFARWAYYADVPFEVIKSRFSFDELFERHERGELEAYEYFACLRSSLGIDLSDDQFVDGWNNIYVGEVAGIAALLRRLKERIPIYAFTNSNATHQQVVDQLYKETLGLFLHIFVSSDMGLRKPEAAAFAAIAADIGVSLDNILFFDDSADNVAGARAVGMQAVQVRTIEDVEHSVRDFL